MFLLIDETLQMKAGNLCQEKYTIEHTQILYILSVLHLTGGSIPERAKEESFVRAT